MLILYVETGPPCPLGSHCHSLPDSGTTRGKKPGYPGVRKHYPTRPGVSLATTRSTLGQLGSVRVNALLGAGGRLRGPARARSSARTAEHTGETEGRMGCRLLTRLITG